jgi:hypothetical protein
MPRTHRENSFYDCPILASAAEIPKSTLEWRTVVEKAYRRGYHQGAWAAYDAIVSCRPQKRVLHWLNVRLNYWRFSKHRGICREPPSL